MNLRKTWYSASRYSRSSVGWGCCIAAALPSGKYLIWEDAPVDVCRALAHQSPALWSTESVVGRHVHQVAEVFAPQVFRAASIVQPQRQRRFMPADVRQDGCDQRD